MLKASEDIINRIRRVIGCQTAQLHEPDFGLDDELIVLEAIRSGFVSSEGIHLTKFEKCIAEYARAKHVVGVSNGTVALQLGIVASGIAPGSEILVPALTFVGSGNAILHANCAPHFVDIELTSFGIDYDRLEGYLAETTINKDGKTINKKNGKQISAIMPVHIFGHIGQMEQLSYVAKAYNLLIIEDAAEALGSWREKTHSGLFGNCGALSFNGNKIITTGGGGALITNSDEIAQRARHLSRTAKVPHAFEYYHDDIGYNHRLPAINAALGLAQMSKLPVYLKLKKELKDAYSQAFKGSEFCDFFEPANSKNSNNWLNAIILRREQESNRSSIILEMHANGIYCRPVWRLLSGLPHMRNFSSMNLKNSNRMEGRILNIPSSSFLIAKQAERATTQ